MAGPSKVQFPGQKKQRMRARGTKRASEGVRKRLEKNLAALLEDPHARMPTVAYTIKRARKDPVQRSLKECAKVIAKKNDRKWLGKRMMRRRGDGVARALAGPCMLRMTMSGAWSPSLTTLFSGVPPSFVGALGSQRRWSLSKILSTQDNDC